MAPIELFLNITCKVCGLPCETLRKKAAVLSVSLTTTLPEPSTGPGFQQVPSKCLLKRNQSSAVLFPLPGSPLLAPSRTNSYTGISLGCLVGVGVGNSPSFILHVLIGPAGAAGAPPQPLAPFHFPATPAAATMICQPG